MQAMRYGETLGRRAFLSRAIGGSLAAIPLRSAAQTSSGMPIRVQIDPEQRLGAIARNFMGLGYEISSVSQPGLLAASNELYVRLVRLLSPSGVIRIGGNTSDYATYSVEGPAVSAPQATVVSRQGLLDLGTFLRATGWQLIWGLNLGRGTVEQAVDEAVAVASAAGERLLAFEIGNEPDMFAGVHRPPNYSCADYLGEYKRYKDAIRAKLPQAPFAGPDVIFHSDWVDQFAAAEGADVKLLTHHYYAEGPPENPTSTLENLLKPSAALSSILGRMNTVAGGALVPYRICEANSCFGGGKPGVSDTTAASLWGLDFLFTMAQFNAGGVNIETGVNHLGFLSWYTPIGVDPAQAVAASAYRAKPIYYGMLAFRLASQGVRVKSSLDNAGLNVSAYAVHSDRRDIWLTMINKEASRDVHARVACPRASNATVIRLSGPSLTSTDGVTLGGTAVSNDGNWSPHALERLRVRGGETDVTVPAGSAALVRFV